MSQTGSAGRSGADWRPEGVAVIMTVPLQPWKNEQTHPSDGRTTADVQHTKKINSIQFDLI